MNPSEQNPSLKGLSAEELHEALISRIPSFKEAIDKGTVSTKQIEGFNGLRKALITAIGDNDPSPEIIATLQEAKEQSARVAAQGIIEGESRMPNKTQDKYKALKRIAESRRM